MSKRKKRHIKRQLIEGNEILRISKKLCIGCTACAFTCARSTKISVIKAVDNGKRTVTPKAGTFQNSGCIYCGQCTLMCPTTAIDTTTVDLDNVKKAMSEKKYIIVTSAPAVKATLWEEFGKPIGTDAKGYFEASARKLGFQKVFDTEFGADVTVVEESTELIKRLSLNEKLPQFTSCCPAWVRWVELFKNEIIPNISAVKSPQQIMGAVTKTYYAEKMFLNPKDIFTVAVKPCTAKTYENDRTNMGRDDYKDIDDVLTVRQYADLLKENDIDLNNLTPENPDTILGEYTGGAVIFGQSSGVAVASLRGAAYYLKDDIEKVNNMKFEDLDDFPGVKASKVTLGGKEINVAIVSGIDAVERLLNTDKWKEFQFIEVMACPGGCVNGGGTPRILKKSEVNRKLCVACGTCIENCPVGAIDTIVGGYAKVDTARCVGCTLCARLCRSDAIRINYFDKATNEMLKESYVKIRRDVLLNLDKSIEVSASPENKELTEMYNTYLGEIGGQKAKELLHTIYSSKTSELARTKEEHKKSNHKK